MLKGSKCHEKKEQVEEEGLGYQSWGHVAVVKQGSQRKTGDNRRYGQGRLAALSQHLSYFKAGKTASREGTGIAPGPQQVGSEL